MKHFCRFNGKFNFFVSVTGDTLPNTRYHVLLCLQIVMSRFNFAPKNKILQDIPGVRHTHGGWLRGIAPPTLVIALKPADFWTISWSESSVLSWMNLCAGFDLVEPHSCCPSLDSAPTRTFTEFTQTRCGHLSPGNWMKLHRGNRAWS